MHLKYQPPLRNKILQALPPAELSFLLPKLDPVTLEAGTRLEEPSRPLSHVYFIEDAICSLNARLGREREAEVGLIGREGMSGSGLALGDCSATFINRCLVAGLAFRMPVLDFKASLRQSDLLRDLCLRYARALDLQIGFNAAVSCQFKIEERLARWLLMVHDRSDGDTIATTHDAVAAALAVRRPGVTVAMHLLEGKGLIRSTRGQVAIRNRAGLLEVGCGTYGLAESAYERLMGLSGESSADRTVSPPLPVELPAAPAG